MARTTKHRAALTASTAQPVDGADAAAPPRSPWRTREQLADRHEERFGVRPSPRSLERWPLTWRYANGVAVADVVEFDAECDRRFNATPAIRGGRRLAVEQQAA